MHLEGTTYVPEATGTETQTFHVFYTKPRPLVTFTSRDHSPLRFSFVQSVHYDEKIAKEMFNDAVGEISNFSFFNQSTEER